ncbi:hypothetical protein [Cupriavidus taiwanensis]|nr:hypothetical protein [Cupriavidus taiwanensis]
MSAHWLTSLMALLAVTASTGKHNGLPPTPLLFQLHEKFRKLPPA